MNLRKLWGSQHFHSGELVPIIPFSRGTAIGCTIILNMKMMMMYHSTCLSNSRPSLGTSWIHRILFVVQWIRASFALLFITIALLKGITSLDGEHIWNL
mmetsp:Transcript_21766/g.53785  ORF Transcript_21766/g.53785 Transcript_21766/m.53785 type:complete len:99 (-) Transcript_21766:276-572(-)